ncbi:MAG: MBL fold metallo-hydrolase [Candidatus Freyarchaeota archaeon]
MLSKIRREGLNVVGIIETHSHTDHYGGTAFIW